MGPKNITMDVVTSVNSVWLCTSCGISLLYCWAHVNKHILLNNIMPMQRNHRKTLFIVSCMQQSLVIRLLRVATNHVRCIDYVRHSLRTGLDHNKEVHRSKKWFKGTEQCDWLQNMSFTSHDLHHDQCFFNGELRVWMRKNTWLPTCKARHIKPRIGAHTLSKKREIHLNHHDHNITELLGCILWTVYHMNYDFPFNPWFSRLWRALTL